MQVNPITNLVIVGKRSCSALNMVIASSKVSYYPSVPALFFKGAKGRGALMFRQTRLSLA